MKISVPALNWPTAAVLAAAIAAIVGVFWLIEPGSRLEAITSVAGVAIPLLAAMEKLFKGDPVVPAADTLEDSRTPPRSEANGRLTGRLPSLKRGWFAGLLALGLGGCSPSALQTHATIGTVASVTVRSLAPVVPNACSAALTSCADDACIVSVTGDCRTAALAYEGARDSVHFYLSAVEVAALADEGSVLPALREALVGLAEFWSRLRDGLALLGVSLPALPPAAAGLIVGAL